MLEPDLKEEREEKKTSLSSAKDHHKTTKLQLM